MCLGRLLKAKDGFSTIASVRVAAWKQWRLGDPHTVFIAPEPHLCEWDNHSAEALTRSASVVKEAFEG